MNTTNAILALLTLVALLQAVAITRLLVRVDDLREQAKGFKVHMSMATSVLAKGRELHRDLVERVRRLEARLEGQAPP